MLNVGDLVKVHTGGIGILVSVTEEATYFDFVSQQYYWVKPYAVAFPWMIPTQVAAKAFSVGEVEPQDESAFLDDGGIMELRAWCETTGLISKSPEDGVALSSDDEEDETLEEETLPLDIPGREDLMELFDTIGEVIEHYESEGTFELVNGIGPSRDAKIERYLIDNYEVEKFA